MEQFLAEHGGDVTGVISGFDRLRLVRRWRRATSARLGHTVKLPPLSPEISYTEGIGPPLARFPTAKPVAVSVAPPRCRHWPLARLGESSRTTPRRLSAQNTIRISGADLPPSLVTGLFNRRPASRYSEAERSEFGSFILEAIHRPMASFFALGDIDQSP